HILGGLNLLNMKIVLPHGMIQYLENGILVGKEKGLSHAKRQTKRKIKKDVFYAKKYDDVLSHALPNVRHHNFFCP
ncbi:hypothetical protein, partial [Capnocytophaga granulosa]|uniref:hypothetical protein n=1 Tax=Capnocytophaga granulosa TaxID=45242 RepID=UPI00360F9D05